MPEKSNKLKDLYFKIAGIPASAFLVIMFYRILASSSAVSWSVGDFIFLLFISVCLWLGNVQVQYLLRPALYKIKNIAGRVLARFASTIIFSSILSFVLFIVWNKILHKGTYDAKTIASLQVISIIISVLISSLYEIVYLHKERESDIVKMERTERSKLQAQLDGLKNQVDPHFIFNSLNTLSYLISQNPETARLFNDTLAKVYRYILVKKEKDLVMLKEEIEFASNYFYLLKIRYQDGLKMTIEFNDIITENYMLPPLSVQILIENAIKHNHFTEKVPLDIKVCVIPDKVTVINNRNVKQFEIQSPQIGLKNLSERYMLITGNSINIQDNKDNFSVVLPLLKT